MPLNHRGFGAYITCDGKELGQYGVQVEDEKLITCWIPSEADKEFKIHWVDHMGETYSSAALYMDGRCLGHVVSSLGGESTMNGWRNTPTSMRLFRFAKLTLTDDENIASAKAQVSEELGTIEVRIRRIRDLGFHGAWVGTGGHEEIGPIHERSKKAGTNCVALGAEIQTAATLSYKNVQFLDVDSFVVFRFRHRTAGMLQAHGIMPPPPRSLDPVTSNKQGKKRSSDEGGSSSTRPPKRLRASPGDQDDKPLEISDDDEDVIALQAQLAKIQKKLEKKKTKKPSGSIVKREHSPIRVVNPSDDVIEIFSD